jgi:hypothetical protein
MLYEFQNYNKHGNIRTRIIPWPNGKAFGINPKGLGSYIGVKVFKYEYKHEILPPGLINAGGKKYIVPGWQEVLPETELNDIKWIKPKPKVVVKQEPIVVTSTSSSSDKTYTTTYYPESGKFWCDCPGMWRSGGNCKHVKSLREKVK